ncbi:MAG: DUF2779 domain-containing protein, partial [Solobacterium sp.]|nr:DUF2779 domain-containing protein [Solobacterium sp.]
VNLSVMKKITRDLIADDIPVIAEASFSFDGLFCSVDILKNKGNNHFELYEVKSSTEVHEIYYHDVSFQVYVLTELGYEVDKACVVYINNKYVRHGELNLKKLFAIKDITEEAKAAHDQVAENVAVFREYLRKRKEPEKDLSLDCFNPYACGFFKYCSRNLPEPNVFDLAGVQVKKQMDYYKEGLISFEDLYHSGVLKEKPMMQIEHELYPVEDHIEVNPIKKFLDTLSYPIYHLDFETFQPAVPLYDDSVPYEQIPFQYSLHYQLEKGGKLYHKEFLAYPGKDPRRDVAERLCLDIQADACVLAYNMAFEKTRIKKLASLYPDLSEHLMSIHDNMKDLIIPFQKRWYYTKAMQGSFSIKYVLPALFPGDPELDYHNLEGVHNGAEAANTFKQMAKMDADTLEEYRHYLLKYCELDTYAMVKVLQKLEQIIEQSE